MHKIDNRYNTQAGQVCLVEPSLLSGVRKKLQSGNGGITGGLNPSLKNP